LLLDGFAEFRLVLSGLGFFFFNRIKDWQLLAFGESYVSLFGVSRSTFELAATLLTDCSLGLSL
jgi:hypothetical protein